MGSKQIMNFNLRSQYQSFLKLLSYQSLDKFTYFETNKNRNFEIILSFIYYLLVQDRINDSLIFYKEYLNKNGNKEINNINVDYLKCYLLLFDDQNEDENIKDILNISNHYLSKNNSSLFPKQKLKLFHAVNKLKQIT